MQLPMPGLHPLDFEDTIDPKMQHRMKTVVWSMFVNTIPWQMGWSGGAMVLGKLQCRGLPQFG